MKTSTFFLVAELSCAAAITTAAEPAGRATFDVRSFGAAGDGKTNDTAAIQRAIDACGRFGGVVLLDRGTFLVGTIRLCSHVELHLTSTAVLLGSTDLAHYAADAKVVYKLLNQSLVYANGCEHVAITGEGTIDGQGKAFRNGDRDQRPVLLRMRDCRDGDRPLSSGVLDFGEGSENGIVPPPRPLHGSPGLKVQENGLPCQAWTFDA